MIGLVMIVRDETATIERCLNSVKPLIGHWTIVDTGSSDGTQQLVKELLSDVPGELHERPWQDFGRNRTEALALARGTADWLLVLDVDMTVQAHPDLLSWLEQDPDSRVAAWMVEIVESGTVWRLPLLVRGDCEWSYAGATHEYLDGGYTRRSLLGLTVTHSPGARPGKLERDLALLKPGLEDGDERAVFYSAECLRFLGRDEEAIDLYRRRATMNGFQEEAWYAAYQAAKLSRSVPELLMVYRERPWRAEPLRAAADLVREMKHDDILFVEGG